jgi:hypothetical protein
LASLALAAFVTLPNPEYPMIANGEYEYQSALTVAFQDHLQWGTQIIWTYGPLGWVNVLTFLDFHTWLVAFALNLLGHAVFFGVLVMFLVHIRARSWQWLAVAAVTVVFFERYQNQGIGFDFERFPVVDHKMAMSAVLLLFVSAETASRRAAITLGAAAGVLVAYLMLDKGTSILVAAGLVAAFALLAALTNRVAEALAFIGATVVAFLLMWVLIGQSPTAIPGYFRSSYELIEGYAGAMSWFNESDQNAALQVGIGYGVLIVGLVSLLVAVFRREKQLAAILLLAAPVAYLSFKNSFVRFDEIHGLTFWSLAAVLLAFALVVATTRPLIGARTAIAALCGAAVVVNAVLVLGAGVALGQSADLMPTLTFPQNLLSYRHAAGIIARQSRRAEETGLARQNLQAAYPLPPDVLATLHQGTVDVIPWDIQLALAYDLKWDPQPVLQSYAAYTPYLDQADANHFNNPDGPRFVVMAAHTIDNRYPLFDEPAAYRALMEHYVVRDVLQDMFVLERVPDASPALQQAAGNITADLNQWIDVPSHGDQRLYANVHVSYSALGQTMALVDRPPELHIRFRYAGGQTSPDYRFVPAVAVDGIDLSTYAPDSASMAALASGQFSQPIESFEIVTDDPAHAYRADVPVSYFVEPASSSATGASTAPE